MVVKLEDRKIFTGLTTPPALNKNFVTQMLARDLFAVANLLVSSFCNCISRHRLRSAASCQLVTAVGHLVLPSNDVELNSDT